MIVGLGTDLVAIARVEALLTRHRDRFLCRVFTRLERDECLGRARPAVHLAARVAAKEAAMKAVGTGWAGGVRWLDIEIGSPGGAVPRLTLGGAILAHASSRGIRETLVSLSHDGDYAVATVVATDGR